MKELAGIIDWLDVEASIRYQPNSRLTFCNIYAYDYCYLAKAYLPRVWWTRRALEKLAQGEKVPVVYGETVTELNANSLLDWLREFGDDFGWERTFDLTRLQESINLGGVGVIVAQRKDLNRSGHITVVVPESDRHRAARKGEEVIRPLQSQAGVANFRYGTGKSPWWQGSQFRGFGFWKHA